ncbi:thioredoxin family protein [Chitinophagales bacterium]|nr:thioredoxin family protein [Chitinophagales bacterium]
MNTIKLLFLLLPLCFLSSISAQEDKLEWFTDLAEAKTYAAENQQDILLVFSGSDWCKPCIQFKEEILLSSEFNSTFSDELVILYVDFPSKKKNKLSKEATEKNEQLAERFNKSGFFPNLFLLNENEEILDNPKYTRQSTTDFIEEISPLLIGKAK